MKIRTDFVTNSSSSSFMLVIRIGLKDGKVLKFMGDGGVGENSERYYELTVNESPETLGNCGSIDELIRMLKRSVVQGSDTYYTEDEELEDPVLDDYDELIKGLRGLDSMDDISTITINGDLFGRGDQYQYKHYTYYRDQKVTVYDEGGDEEIIDEGTGGSIEFYNPGKWKKADGFGKTEIAEYEYFDEDVPLKTKTEKLKKKSDPGFEIKKGVLKKYKGRESVAVIPEDVKIIASNAFDFSGIEGVCIPEGVQKIGSYAFSGCENLEEIVVPNSVQTIEAGAFSSCPNLKKIKLPAGLEELSENLFSDDGLLEDVQLPESVVWIHEYAFSDCTNLKKIEIPKRVYAISSCAFKNTGIVELKIPEKLSPEMFDRDAVYECKGLKRVELPEKFRDITEKVNYFIGCDNLTEIIYY